jgi:hypothetical protein
VLFTHSDYPEFRLALGKGSHGQRKLCSHLIYCCFKGVLLVFDQFVLQDYFIDEIFHS